MLNLSVHARLPHKYARPETHQDSVKTALCRTPVLARGKRHQPAARGTTSVALCDRLLSDRLLSDRLRRSFGACIEFAELVAPAVKARSGLAREQIGAAHGRRRVLGHNAVELIGLARVLACNAVEERRQRL